MRSFEVLKERWDEDFSHRSHRATVQIDDNGLVLGADTILVRMGVAASAAKHLDISSDRERLLALLSVAFSCQVPREILKNVENASEQWRLGEKALANIHLSFARLPRLESKADAYCLYLAGALLDDGLAPNVLLRELGLDRTKRKLAKFDPNQPRVPAGSGRESGQWAKGGEAAEGGANHESLSEGAGPSDHEIKVAGDVIVVGTLVGTSISRVAGEFPKTTCFYTSSLGDFKIESLGIRACKGIWPHE